MLNNSLLKFVMNAGCAQARTWQRILLLSLGLFLVGCARQTVRSASTPNAILQQSQTSQPVSSPTITRQSARTGLDLKPVPASSHLAGKVISQSARSLVGTPYHYGGNSPATGFDCSGLINYVYRQSVSLQLPRTSRQLIALPQPWISQRQRLSSGDLVFFRVHGRISHVGIYVGDNQFVHAPRTGGEVRLGQLDNVYWRRHFRGAKHVLPTY